MNKAITANYLSRRWYLTYVFMFLAVVYYMITFSASLYFIDNTMAGIQPKRTNVQFSTTSKNDMHRYRLFVYGVSPSKSFMIAVFGIDFQIQIFA